MLRLSLAEGIAKALGASTHVTAPIKEDPIPEDLVVLGPLPPHLQHLFVLLGELGARVREYHHSPEDHPAVERAGNVLRLERMKDLLYTLAEDHFAEQLPHMMPFYAIYNRGDTLVFCAGDEKYARKQEEKQEAMRASEGGGLRAVRMYTGAAILGALAGVIVGVITAPDSIMAILYAITLGFAIATMSVAVVMLAFIWGGDTRAR